MHAPHAFLLMFSLLASAAQAADLEERANRAFDEYATRARKVFLDHAVAARAIATQDEGVAARPGRDEGIVEVPGGLVHHWAGAVFIRGATLRQVLEVSYAYRDYRTIYRSIVASRLLGRDGNTFRVLLRIREDLIGTRAIFDVRSKIEYFHPGERRAYAVSSDEEIREVENPGQADERLLPPGQDSGYLWRSGTLTSFAEHDGGVTVELQTLGLSRDFGPLLRWVTDPIARHIGRKSVEDSLEDLRAAVKR